MCAWHRLADSCTWWHKTKPQNHFKILETLVESHMKAFNNVFIAKWHFCCFAGQPRSNWHTPRERGQSFNDGDLRERDQFEQVSGGSREGGTRESGTRERRYSGRGGGGGHGRGGGWNEELPEWSLDDTFKMSDGPGTFDATGAFFSGKVTV